MTCMQGRRSDNLRGHLIPNRGYSSISLHFGQYISNLLHLQWNAHPLAPENVCFCVLLLAGIDVLLAQKHASSEAGAHYAMCNPL